MSTTVDERDQALRLFEPIPLARRNFEAVAEQLRLQIASGRLAPGQKLPSEPELARQFNVGRSAVREALKTLELAGLLTVRRGYSGGTFVATAAAEPSPLIRPLALPPSEAARAELREARETVEPRIAALAARAAGGEAGTQLELAAQAEAAQLELPAGFVAAYVAFHALLAELAGNTIYGELMRALRGPLAQELGRHVGDLALREAVVAQHRALAATVVAGDAEGAADLMLAHLRFLAERQPPA